jgi:glycosyltransferase involved in cell wall biosynthesis
VPEPLVTTIIPVFNRGAMMREAVASVIAQTFRPIEVIVVDDGSTDDTPEVADDLAREHAELRVIRQTNGGPGVAREAGRISAKGDYIQHLDSDDLLDRRKFEHQVAALELQPQCGAAYGKVRIRRRDGSIESSPSKRSGERIATMFPAMLESRWWDTPAPLYRASLIRESGPWLPLRMEEDWEYDCRIASRGVSLCFIDEWVCEVRRHGDHLSGHQNAAVLRDRATAHAAILGHARHTGIADDTPEMKHFARELFLLSRQCGTQGLTAESATLFKLAREASGKERDRLQFRAFDALTRLAGWRTAGKLSEWMDRWR